MRLSESEFKRLFPDHPSAEKRANIPSKMSALSFLEETFCHHLLAFKLPTPKREYRFHRIRRWRFDFAWPECMLAVEIEGGVTSYGRHVRPQGFQNDCHKYNAAALKGWTVLRYTASDINKGVAVGQVKKVLSERLKK